MGVYWPEDELSWNNREEVLRLPVAPTSPPEIHYPAQNETWNTTDVGPFKAIGHPGLFTVTIEGFFPAQDYSFNAYKGVPAPENCVKAIKRWIKSRRPIRYIRTGVFNEAFSIENFSYYKETGTGDIYYTLELEQYRFLEEANSQTGNSFRDGYSTEVAEEVQILHQLVKGETLCELAELYLGDSDRYAEIAEANGIKDMGHPWSETEPLHQLWIVCEEGTPGHRKVKSDVENGVAVG